MINLKGYIQTICKQNEKIDAKTNRARRPDIKVNPMSTRKRISCDTSPSSSSVDLESKAKTESSNDIEISGIRTRSAALADKIRRHVRKPIVYDLEEEREEEEDKSYQKRKADNDDDWATFKKRRFDEESPKFKKLTSPSISSSSLRRSSSAKATNGKFETPPVYKNKDGDYFVAFYTNKYVFSNHFPCPQKFELEGHEFPTSEHYYMYHKALFHGDKEAAESILKEPCPKTAKRITADFRNFDAKKWDDISVEVMRKGVMAKFDQNTELRRELFKTGNATLVEAAPRDRRWGVGLNMSDPDVANQAKWKGQNLLGQILMGVRTTLAAQYPEEFESLKPSSERMLQNAVSI
ncbi:unnamed protein product [Bursaphelenchus xylophilus]|uniref:(pine wood nematode) hypothetical protein n=1 Tax=Bursaphelenchus xylophilus TaxID=6326 RepID=A0A1I7RR23_BURXY|nr:unnamed protein product [Bursaphelenchus xylophilus]CAG9130812.1 unnamed protein product [Bursaphelenchus xylophilus]